MNNPMTTTRASLLNLGLCLGRFLVMFPRSTASVHYVQTNYTFPDGSICYVCDYEWVFEASSHKCPFSIQPPFIETPTYCAAPDGACHGSYYLDNEQESIGLFVTAFNKCFFDANNYSETGGVSDASCCFKPDSIV